MAVKEVSSMKKGVNYDKLAEDALNQAIAIMKSEGFHISQEEQNLCRNQEQSFLDELNHLTPKVYSKGMR